MKAVDFAVIALILFSVITIFGLYIQSSFWLGIATGWIAGGFFWTFFIEHLQKEEIKEP